MPANTRITVIHALSALHAGTGQGVGDIDLPIARETATGIPYLPGSSLKGSLRAACEPEELRRLIFGPDTANASDSAGSVLVSDQRLLLLPVRSLAGTFALVTSPYVLQRLKRDLRFAGYPALLDIPALSDLREALITSSTLAHSDNKIFLEDLDLIGQQKQEAKAFAQQLGALLFADDSESAASLTSRLCIVHDDVFSFLLETATEITARIRLDEEKKTVAKGALWYEEALPAESVLTGLIIAQPPGNIAGQLTNDKIFNELETAASRVVQLGGKSTVGRGLCSVKLAKEQRA